MPENSPSTPSAPSAQSIGSAESAESTESTDSTDSTDARLCDDFLSLVIDGAIRAFMVSLKDSQEMRDELILIGHEPAAIAAYARGRGYNFSAGELAEYFEKRMARLLPAWHLRLREQQKQRWKSGAATLPRKISEPTTAEFRALDYEPGFVLDRKFILDGHILTIARLPAIARLVGIIRRHLEAALAPHAPIAAGQALAAGEYKKKIVAAYAALGAEAAIPQLMRDLAHELAMEEEGFLFEWPGFRLIGPKGGGGFYRDGETGAVGPHRDTWYGSPYHQINFWGPLSPLAPGAQLHIFPNYFRKSLKNTTRGYDVWRQNTGLSLVPLCGQKISPEGCIAPLLADDQVLCYSANHLHASGRQPGPGARVSFEFRLAHRADKARRHGAENVDYRGFGEIYDGWFGLDGHEVETTI